ncbi:MAG: hydrolase 1, exosortase A system-associated [Sphingopyxis sp.]|nr:hydrolase 1, exosortase A system-associated [Sphingopyxis sp.]
MRHSLTFACNGSTLAATLDAASGTTGLLIVSGGNEIRCGAHRGMAVLAQRIAGAGHPVLRFDRRGVGDSEGENDGFLSSRDDIAAALNAFRAASPALERVVAFGNCDAASALLLHQPLTVDALVLANPWTMEADGAEDGNNGGPALPPSAAIRARYLARLRDPASLRRLLRGEIDLGKLRRGMTKLLPRQTVPASDSLGQRVVSAIADLPIPATLLVATGDRTAQAFTEHWKIAPRELTARIPLVTRDSASHSFAGDDAVWLAERLLTALATAT